MFCLCDLYYFVKDFFTCVMCIFSNISYKSTPSVSGDICELPAWWYLIVIYISFIKIAFGECKVTPVTPISFSIPAMQLILDTIPKLARGNAVVCKTQNDMISSCIYIICRYTHTYIESSLVDTNKMTRVRSTRSVIHPKWISSITLQSICKYIFALFVIVYSLMIRVCFPTNSKWHSYHRHNDKHHTY